MLKYYTESEENINMDVQVGPGKEITASVEEEGYNAVKEAKKDPNSVVVAAKKTSEGCCEFYVAAADIEKHAELNEQSMLESLNDIIACHEDSGMSASNIVIVVDEGTMGYVRNLEKHGAACIRFVHEEGVEDIEIDVQVGPQEDEMKVSADPQEANPVDAVKRQYDTVVVAKDGDDFFMDVEDVQKCAELNCESVIETINGIIACNEEYDMNTQNVHVIINENADIDAIIAMESAGVLLEANFSFFPKLIRDPAMKDYVSDLKEAEALCKQKNIETKAGAMKFFRIALRILNIFEKAQSIIAIPVIISIVGIIPYLLIRAMDWLTANGEEAVAKSEGAKVIDALDKAIAKENNAEEKKKLQEARDKIAKKMKNVDSVFDV